MGANIRLMVALATLLFLADRYAPAQNYIGAPLNMNTTQVSVGTSATLIETNRARASVTVVNTSTNACYLGGSSAVTSSNGVYLAGIAGAAVTIPYTGPVWGVCASAETVSVMDLY